MNNCIFESCFKISNLEITKRNEMKLKITFIILFTNIFINVFGQDVSNFKVEFASSLNNSFDEKQINNLFSKYSNILTPQSDITQLVSGIKGENLTQYPLKDFKNEDLYKDNIDMLLNSKNSFHRLLSYLVIGASDDSSKEKILLKRLVEEKEKGNLIWCGMALLNIKTKHTTELFDFLIKNEDFGDSHMLPLFIQLDKDSLRETAYRRYNNEDINTKILAIQILSQTGKNPKTEKIVLDAVKNWDFNIKGYAIYTVKELQIGNLLETFKPLLENDKTRKIALEALANSPTKEDNDYLLNLANQKDSISNDLLDCFYKSKNIENLRIWLQFLVSKKVSDDYYFFVADNKLIHSNELLESIQNTLKQTKNEKIIGALVKALQGRKDAESTNILINFLMHNDETIRYWSADALKGNKTENLKQKLPTLINDEKNRTTALVNLLIENKINNQQDLFEKIYIENKDKLDWKRSSIEYLSNFPLEKNKEIFKSIVKDKDADFSEKYGAALGLGRLKDINSVDLLIQECEKVRKESDLNARTYLIALGMIKGEKAKKEIQSFLKSDEQLVSELAKGILEKWEEN
jgi:HEAT repeat protein